MPGPHEVFVEALTAAGWDVVRTEPAHQGPNPGIVEIRRDRTSHLLLVYAWRITSEGTGRVKAGRTDLDYRIQTTRSHGGPLEILPAHVTLGLGWDGDRAVFGAFDPWMKRYTGVSSSVHFTRALLDAGAREGWAEELREDGPEVAFSSPHVDRFLEWAFSWERRPLFKIEPERFDRNDQEALMVIDPLRDRQGYALRPGDSVVILTNGRIADPSIWAVTQINQVDKTTSSGNYNRVMLEFSCRRTGVINDVAALEREMA